ncbi:MAG: hypothetical protein KKB20_30500 [Proteobacteria bacterium]|nr:hypothetical protein [Pseudomonadota bacterium]
MAHILGGVQDGRRVLPCLYDHDLQAKPGRFRNHYQFYLINVGYFDPMSCHFYGLKNPPPGLCAWSRMRLEWMKPRSVKEVPRGQTMPIRLLPLAGNPSGVQAVKLPVDRSTYFLIENRQPMGSDLNLPSHGVLIYRADDQVEECRHGRAPVKLEPADDSAPELKGAPFTMAGRSTYRNDRHGVRVRLLSQQGPAYRIEVSNGR